jgi:lysophospholipase L1-like esterase
VTTRRRGWHAAWAFVACVAAAGCSRDAPPLAGCTLPADGTVLAVGDSITRGFGADGRGYPEQLQALLAATPGRAGVTVVNRGIDGERSAGLLARIGDELSEHRPAVVLLTIGGNDFLRRVPETQTRTQIDSIVDRIRESGAFPIVFAIPEPGLGAVVGRPQEHPLYAELARRDGLLVIEDVVAEVLGDETLKADAIHPNAEGYAAMARAAAAAIALCR